jgi:CRISPR system Cascade subunit CasA
MDNMKARCWHEAQYPVTRLETQLRQEYECWVAVAIRLADVGVGRLRFSVRKAWISERSETRADLSFVDLRFWKQTERSFYEQLGRCRDSLGDTDTLAALKLDWFNLVRGAALAIFDDVAQTAQLADANPKRVAIARRSLERSLAVGSKSLRNLLDLPDSEG